MALDQEWEHASGLPRVSNPLRSVTVRGQPLLQPGRAQLIQTYYPRNLCYNLWISLAWSCCRTYAVTRNPPPPRSRSANGK